MIMRCNALLVTCFVTTGLFVFCTGSGLKAGDPGVCLKYLTRHVRVSYIGLCEKSNGRCRKYKYQMRRDESPTPYCCENWKFSRDDDKCKPLCSRGCFNGRCESPNHCVCDPPLVLHNENTCEQPTCDPPCFNGKCVKDNTCLCSAGFEAFNNTHCAPICARGYYLNPASLECTPKCNKPCVNGTCTAPDTCTCLQGFKLSDDIFKCIPDCNPSCVDGICVEPDVCRCLPGYTADLRNKCKPVCRKCKHGECIAPDTCQCHEGYSMINGTCTPKCDESCIMSNGYCFEPNVCTCSKGFKLDSKTKCIPVCEPECQNGICLSPNDCSCYEGYMKTNSSFICEAKCDNCDHGVCLNPNECQCDEGYIRSNDSCSPVCNQPCVNGHCGAPDTCECHEGYSMINGTCTPKCEKSCIISNGYCFEPNVCTCSTGFELDISDVSKSKCIPVCEPECQNGICLSPNNCSCHEGYVTTNSSFICEAKCDYCDHGVCLKPNECQCVEGYLRSNGSCSPVCHQPCVNGHCSAPDICRCETGYTVSEKSKYECEPVCNNSCVNSTCESPDTCFCLPGFQATNVSYVCEPKCNACIDGICVAPDECTCQKGYALEFGRCMPFCENPCINGDCRAPNYCSCKEEYVQHETKPYICYKICEDSRRCIGDGCCEAEPVECGACNGSCVDGICSCANSHSSCYDVGSEPQGLDKTNLAGLEMSWIYGAGVGFLLIIILVAVVVHMYRRRHTYETKNLEGDFQGSVIFTAPDMLISRHSAGLEDDFNKNFMNRNIEQKLTSEPLLNNTNEPHEEPIV